ncbi:hypothetical protein BDZ91DRAFT_730739 [Kalaharituber pfeilii]|nr:hypothetical protein BDZ91DRAFT_730739 [Kalaharituber pfeilii]
MQILNNSSSFPIPFHHETILYFSLPSTFTPTFPSPPSTLLTSLSNSLTRHFNPSISTNASATTPNDPPPKPPTPSLLGQNTPSSRSTTSPST